MNSGWIDFLRTLVIGHGISIFILTVVVFVRYAKLLMKKPGKDRRVPWHILSIAISYFLGTILACGTMAEKLGDPFSWRLPVAAMSFMLGNVGLFLIASYIKDELDENYRF